jgi:hypothetical protein
MSLRSSLNQRVARQQAIPRRLRFGLALGAGLAGLTFAAVWHTVVGQVPWLLVVVVAIVVQLAADGITRRSLRHLGYNLVPESVPGPRGSRREGIASRAVSFRVAAGVIGAVFAYFIVVVVLVVVKP